MKALVVGVLAWWHLAGLLDSALPTPTAEGSPPRSIAGQLLVAAPSMPDPRFAETVIYMVRHDAGGARGLVVNRPIGEVPMARVLEHLALDSQGATGTIRVHYGGPVARERGFVLHSTDYLGDGTEIIDGGIALTDDPGILRALATGTGPGLSLFAFGYAGWAPGQLETEMASGHWVVVPADDALVFGDDYAGKWERARRRRTIEI